MRVCASGFPRRGGAAYRDAVYEPTTVPQAGYSPAPGGPPGRRPARTAAFVVGLVVLGCCAAGVIGAVVGKALRDAGETASSMPGIGDAVRDGQFEFVVSSVGCGRGEIVNGILRARAQGQFCVVELSVRNVGDEGRQFTDGWQQAFDPAGARYSADTRAGIVANGDGAAVWNVVNPGNSIRALVVYDIPPTATLSTVELHDSAFSGGVRVDLVGPAVASGSRPP